MTFPELRNQMQMLFNMDELDALCYDLGINPESIIGDTPEEKARHLIDFCQRRGALKLLIENLRTLRPLTSWDLPALPDGQVIITRARDEEILLDRVKKTWIEKKLKREAPTERWLEIDKLFNGEPTAGEVLDILSSDRAAVILGDPGSGKTISICKLVQSLHAKALTAQSNRLPVILNVSSWNLSIETGSRAHFVAWFNQAFHDEYRRGDERGGEWLQENKLFVILDGIDQIAPEYRFSFISSLNDYYDDQGWTDVIVTCRQDVFSNLETIPGITDVIELLPLSHDGLSDNEHQQKLSTYLAKVEKEDESVSGLATLLAGNDSLRGFVRTPLMLRLMVDVYKNQPDKIMDLVDIADYDQVSYLLHENYVKNKFHELEEEAQEERQDIEYQPAEASYWLSQISRKKETDRFYIEQMQPDWLSSDKQLVNKLLMTLLMTLLIGLPTGILFGLSFSAGIDSISQGLIAGLVPGLITGLILAVAYFFLPSGWIAEIFTSLAIFLFILLVFRLAWGTYYPGIGVIIATVMLAIFRVTAVLQNKKRIIIDTFDFSWSRAFRQTVIVLIFGFVAGILLETQIPGTFELLSFATIFATLITFSFTLKYPIAWREIESPNEGIRLALRNALISGGLMLVFAWILVLLVAFADTLREGREIIPYQLWAGGPELEGAQVTISGISFGGYLDALAIAMPIGIMVFLINGGAAVLRHYCLQMLLKQEGTIPQGDISHFLDFADYKLNVLRRMGGGYEFIPDFGGYFVTRDDER